MLDQLLPNEIMALTVFGEARGESIDGQVAVAHVILNRFTANPKKYKTLANVCLEPLQFSCWNDSDPNKAKLIELSKQFINNNVTNPILKQIYYICMGVIGNHLLDNTNNSVNYLALALFNSNKKPSWAKSPRTIPKIIGNHVFFNA